MCFFINWSPLCAASNPRAKRNYAQPVPPADVPSIYIPLKRTLTGAQQEMFKGLVQKGEEKGEKEREKERGRE